MSRVLDPKAANVAYHDAAARAYDDKWSISFDERCIAYVRERAERMLPAPRYGRVLEVGAGTGFFLLNLWQAGFVGEAHASDISPGMLEAFRLNADALGCPAEVRVGDAEGLPHEDGAFDLVVGHAFLHHLPDPSAALREFHRVLAPGGALFLAGEPTRLGDRIAEGARRTARALVGVVARLRPGIRRPHPPPATEEERVQRELEWHVDLHTFDPAELIAMAGEAGFTRVRVETEELLSSVFGWAVRTVEHEVRPEVLGEGWPWFAYRTYLRLYAVDRLLDRVVPRSAFHNALLYGERRR
ncbi:MAG: class I SAM-dependent methyltransferase [Actinobacteria bacterium]|nr:class I SAM-dependent methyltransferase [Actinomycetota bacterium]